MIYFDNAATTPLKEEVLQAMLPYMKQTYYNPSALYGEALKTRASVEQAREDVANVLGASVKEIYFTGSGTESDNWALKSTAAYMRERKGRNKILISSIEHHAVLHTAQSLEKQGYIVKQLPVDGYGNIDFDVYKSELDDTTAICSIIMANNEIGTIQDIKKLADAAHEVGAYFHTDAVQAVGSVPVDVEQLSVDMLSLSAHKFFGPKGMGVLYAKKGTPISGLIEGGAQERGKRAGTENVAGIIGLAKALTIATQNLEQNYSYTASLRDSLQAQLLKDIPKIKVNGNENSRLPGILNVSFEGIEGEGILLMLDMQGIAASSGSACASGSLDPSHVIMALGMSHGMAQGTIRLSLSHTNNQDEVDKTVAALKGIVSRLRMMSPIWEE